MASSPVERDRLRAAAAVVVSAMPVRYAPPAVKKSRQQRQTKKIFDKEGRSLPDIKIFRRFHGEETTSSTLPLL